MNWNGLPEDAGVPNLALCRGVQPSQTCLSTHKGVITVSALNINLKQGEKKKKGKKTLEGHFSSMLFWFFFYLGRKEGDWHCAGEAIIKMEWGEERL